jgi:CRP/FNR family transcriptional regulator
MLKEEVTLNFSHIFEPDLIKEILQVGVLKKVKENDLLLDIGQKFDKIPLVLSGAIKISREDENGDEIALYFLEKGDTCNITFGSGLNSDKSKIRGVAEKDSEILFIPLEKLEEWMITYKSWRNFVINSYNTRLSEMLEAIDTLAFLKMDQRLYKHLSDKVKIMQSNTLNTTHEQIALDLNTSRVVISRLLKKLENEQKIKLFRNKIEVLIFDL